MGEHLTLAYLLNLFDLICTLHWFKLYGIGIEANPIGRWLISTNLLIPVKTIGIGACFIALYACVKRKPQYAWACWVVCGVYGILAIYHVILIFILMR